MQKTVVYALFCGKKEATKVQIFEVSEQDVKISLKQKGEKEINQGFIAIDEARNLYKKLKKEGWRASY